MTRSDWISYFDALLRPGARRESDASAVAEHNFHRFDLDLPEGLELQWLGTAGFRIGYQGYTILIDPYFSRPRMRSVFSRQRLPASFDPLTPELPTLDAILVGHTHFDHALDVPSLARRSACRVYGSNSLARLMALHGLPELAVEVELGRVYEAGPFEITFVASQHSKLLLGMKVPMAGEICCESLAQLSGSAYRCGQVYGIHLRVAGRSFYHQGSANLVDDAIIHRGVDYFLCGISGRGFTERYMPRILERLQPRVIVPTHYDNFFAPFGRPLEFLTNVDVAGFVDEVRAVSREFEVRSLDLLQVIGSGQEDPIERG